MKIVECVSNFSEGRRKEVIDEIAKAIRNAGVEILDVESNEIHNRCVITFVGGLNDVAEAAFLGAKRAAELIDLNKHEGEHPRIGACDVIPFIPITASIEECKAIAEQTGKKIASELHIPIYFYEENARIKERKRLEKIRKGNYEWLKEHFDERPADIGDRIHPTAGATVVGARRPLIAYNVYLNKPSDAMGKKIAKAVRESSGGLKNVKAIGFVDGQRTQISMNLVDFNTTPMYRAFELIKDEAERYGAVADEGEIVGLIPEKALIDSAMHYLQLNSFDEKQILEKRLESLFAMQRVYDFASALASSNPVPGGGSASAIVGAFSCALAEKVCALSGLYEEKEKLEALRDRFFGLAQKDSAAFMQVMDAYRVPKEQEDRKERIQGALKHATLVPLETYSACKAALEVEEKVLERGKKNALSDVQSAIELARSAMKCARYNVEINLDSIRDEKFKSEISTEIKDD
ncbi:MAG: glutamate formimidoyltransferase [Candidatus Thermoplasmatota archaeon]|nr:glutamate formimidoyltransferase [Candidatus Thermoplasmatota archaeon]